MNVIDEFIGMFRGADEDNAFICFSLCPDLSDPAPIKY
jgi:hypothetical protein